MRWSDCILQRVEEEVEKTEQYSFENHSMIAQWVVQLTCIQEVMGSNSAGEELFCENQCFLHTRLL